MTIRKTSGIRQQLSSHARICTFVVGFAIACSHGASAQTTPVSPRMSYDTTLLSAQQLENIFWACDYAATTRGVLATPVATCSTVFDDLKNVRFGGDFDGLVNWWRENKDAEHAKIAGREQQAVRDAAHRR